MSDTLERPDSPALELTILMPCLNEAETIGGCVRAAVDYLTRTQINGEVLIADNGSTDGSPQIAENLGARIVPVSARGYGAALLGGIAAARGRFIIMGDADGSYDFASLDPFIAKLRDGYDLVMGNRFAGGVAPGAMPFLHRYLGNPVLSGIGRLLYNIGCRDFNCGLRGFDAARMRAVELTTPGMEFASEMVVRSALAGHRITEVPTTLAKDGRSRPPHLRTWSDGWRHLRFLLMFSPRWLFLYPGLFLIAFGVVAAALLLPGPLLFTPTFELDLHTLIVGAFAIVIGVQCVSFAVIVRRYAASRGFLPASGIEKLDFLTLERVLIAAGILLVLGLGGMMWCVITWASTGFGALDLTGRLIRVLTISVATITLALQIGFSAFVSEILHMKL
jgi:glycosyltransferase involved in cell wall biosynthesis